MTNEIIFDTESGISVEEQQEILAGLDTLTGDHLADAALPLEKEAKKTGALFPALVNGAALLLLAGILTALFLSHTHEQVRFEQGGVILGLTERKLIAEIRKETGALLSAKDAEIADILAKIAGIDRQLQDLQTEFEGRVREKEAELRAQMQKDADAERDRLNNQRLPAATVDERMRIFDEQQIARLNTELAAFKERLASEKSSAQADLQKLKDEYQAQLAALQRERGQILEDARVREANLHEQLIVKTTESAEIGALYEQTQSNLSAAQEQLRSLTSETEAASLIEAQLSAYYTIIDGRINDGQFDEAAATLASMKDFLETPSFQNSRPFKARKAAHLATIGALSILLDTNTQLRSAAGTVPPPPATDADISTDALSNEKLIADLREQAATLQQTIAERDQTISAYKSQGSNANTQDAAMSALRSQNAALQQTLAARDSALNELRTQGGGLQQTLAARESTITELRTQNSTLQQTVFARESTITELQAQNTTLQQTAEQLRRQNDAIRQALSGD
jgi:chromosome segregation ATPase